MDYVPPSDGTAPTITTRYRTRAPPGVAVGTNVGVTFSETIATASVTASSFRLRAQGAGADVPATLSVLARR